MLRHACKSRDYAFTGGLESIMAAFCWNSKRVIDAHPNSEPEVCKCGEISPDDLHSCWTCPLSESHEHKDVCASNKFVQLAVEQIHSYPCLWIRGILPHCLVKTSSVPADTHALCFIGPTKLGNEWPSGCWGADASGGTYTSIPSFRHVGIGICMLQPTRPHQLSIGCCSLLPGRTHTVPRGEFFAIPTISRHAQYGG